MGGVRKAIGPVMFVLTAALLLAMLRATSVSLAGPAPKGTPKPDKIVSTSSPGGPQIFIKTAQWGVPSALLEWEATQLLKEEGIFSFRGPSPVPFTMLSVGWLATDHDADPAEFTVAIRTRKGKASWTEWIHIPGDIGPDDSPSRLFWSHLYIPSDFGVHTDFEVRVRPPVGASLTFVRISVADTSAGLRVTGFLGERIGKRTGSPVFAAGPLGPYIIPRSVWWGDLPPEELNSPGWTPSYQNITHALIHHTVTANNPPNPPQVVRSIWLYHAKVREWGDIGYNFLIDHFGNIYHGRYNPELDTEDVIGAHARGYNAGSMGVALIGQFHPSYEDPPAGEPALSALRSTESLLAWRFQQRHLDPLGQATLVDKFICRIAGHRDVGDSVCPGDTLYALLPAMRTNVHTLMASTYTLKVNSSNPGSGVSVEVSPKDNNGQAGGVTPFTRTYSHNTVITLSAPSTAESNSFQKWQINGMDYASISCVDVTMSDNYTMTAVYEETQPSRVYLPLALKE